MFQPPTAVRAAWEKPPDPRCGTRAELFDALRALEREKHVTPRVLLVADVDGFRGSLDGDFGSHSLPAYDARWYRSARRRRLGRIETHGGKHG